MQRTIIEFADITGKPRVRKDLPGLLRLGDRVTLKFTLNKADGHRSFELKVAGEFKVTGISIDASDTPTQVLVVEAVGVTPVWKAVKNQPPPARKLGPTRFGPTQVA